MRNKSEKGLGLCASSLQTMGRCSLWRFAGFALLWLLSVQVFLSCGFCDRVDVEGNCVASLVTCSSRRLLFKVPLKFHRKQSGSVASSLNFENMLCLNDNGRVRNGCDADKTGQVQLFTKPRGFLNTGNAVIFFVQFQFSVCLPLVGRHLAAFKFWSYSKTPSHAISVAVHFCVMKYISILLGLTALVQAQNGKSSSP